MLKEVCTLSFKAHEYIILKEIKNTKANQQDVHLLIKFTILHGQLMDVINWQSQGS